MTNLLTEEAFAAGVAGLAERDRRLRRVVEVYGAPPFTTRPAGFPTLVLLVLEQQVSVASAAACFRRIAALAEPLTPAALLQLPDAVLREAGVSRQKARYLRRLAEMLRDGELDLDEVGAGGEEQARALLTAVPGIGPWTADVYLLECLRMPDVWPIGDRALQVAAAEVLQLRTVPNQAQLGQIGERWRPLRAVAARLLWHAYLTSRGRSLPTLALSPHAAPDA